MILVSIKTKRKSSKTTATTDLTPTARTRNFKFQASNHNDESTNGKIQASSYAEAKYKLEIQRLTIVELEEEKSWRQIEIGSVVPPADVLQFSRQLSSFAQAGIPVSRGLQVLSKSTQNKKLRRAIDDIRMEVEAGGSFSEAIKHQGRVFPSYFTPIISAAERTGSIAESLITLNEYLERDLRSRRAVKSAMSYPIVLSILSLVAISTLSLVVLPRFESFFSSLDVELPLPTRILLMGTRFFGAWWWALLLALLGLLILYYVLRERPAIKLIIDNFKLRFPVFGSLAQLVAVERFCRILSTLVRNQVPLVDAMLLAGKGTANRVFEVGVEKARNEVLDGKGLAEPLGNVKCFPQLAIDILRVGEESGQLELQLSQASNFFSEELDFRMKNFTALVEPVVLLILGSGIGFVAVALISAMYGIYSGVQG